MDRNQLEQELSKFCKACQDQGLPIIIEGLSEAYPGVANTSYTIHIRVEQWGGELSCSQILDKLIPILFQTTEENARHVIFSFDVYNAINGQNCHHVDTYTRFELAC